MRRLLIECLFATACATVGTWVAGGHSAYTPSETATPAVEVTTCADAYCTPEPSARDQALIKSQERKGLTCTERPTLTDAIVYHYKSNASRLVTLDRALSDSGKGRGWVMAYCA